MDIGLYTQAGTFTIPAGTDRVRTTGFSTSGVGGADYIYDATLASTASPTSFTSANGRRFRLDPEQRLTIEMYGGRGDLQAPNGLYGPTASGTDNLPAFNAYWMYAQYQTADILAVSAPTLHFLNRGYYFSGPLEPRAAVHLVGEGGGSGVGTVLRFPADTCGLIINSRNTTSTGTGDLNTPMPSAEGSTIEHINFIGSGSSAPARDKHGSWLRAPANLVHCGFINFSGCGTAIIANSTVPGMISGNVSGARVEHCYYEGNRGIAAFLARGTDSNTNKIDQIRVRSAFSSAIVDQSSFGNVYTGVEIDGWGDARNGRTYYSGQNYLLIYSAPGKTVPGSNPRVWLPVGAASGPSIDFPEWSSSTLYEPNLPMLIEGDTNATAVLGGYAEQSVPGSANYANSSQSVATIQGGTWTWVPGSNHIFTSDSNTQKLLFCKNGVGGYQDWSSSNLRPLLGSFSFSAVGWKFGDTYAHFANVDAREGGPWVLQPDGGGNLHYNYRGLDTGGPRIYAMTLTTTGVTFGRSGTVPAVFTPYTLAVGDGSSDLNRYRIVAMASAAPTGGSHAKGEVVFNNGTDTSHDGVDYWRCTVAGTPGTWVARP